MEPRDLRLFDLRLEGQVRAVGMFSDGVRRAISSGVQFEMREPEYAAVDSEGRVTALQVGYTRVIASYDGQYASSGVTVESMPCYADCDGSGDLDFIDFLCFQDLFSAMDPAADCDGDDEFTFFDFLCFQNAFAAGCP